MPNEEVVKDEGTYIGNADQLAFLAAACKALDTISEVNNESKTFLYLGRVEVRCEGMVAGWFADDDGTGYVYYQKG